MYESISTKGLVASQLSVILCSFAFIWHYGTGQILRCILLDFFWLLLFLIYPVSPGLGWYEHWNNEEHSLQGISWRLLQILSGGFSGAFYKFSLSFPVLSGYINFNVILGQKLGGATAEIMSDLLAFEADRRAVNITINRYVEARKVLYNFDCSSYLYKLFWWFLLFTLSSIGTELTRDDRRKLYSNFGLL